MYIYNLLYLYNHNKIKVLMWFIAEMDSEEFCHCLLVHALNLFLKEVHK